jgi:hypothetical protein
MSERFGFVKGREHMRSRDKARFLKRLRMVETLESRSMLASVTGDSPWQNPVDGADLNCDGTLSAADALVAINAINSGTSGDLQAKVAPMALWGRVEGAAKDYLDADGDGQLTAVDPLTVINAINSGRHFGWQEIPAEDAQADEVGSSAQSLDLSHGFVKVRSAINVDGDLDVFQVAPTKGELNIALLSGAKGALHLSVVTINLDDAGQPILDADGNPVTTEVASADTVADSHQPAKINVDVKAGTTYYLVVSGDAGVMGGYALAVLNYESADFTPVTDSPLGTDIHGNKIGTATTLTLNNGRTDVTSNIDPVTDGTEADQDFFKIDAVAGKLAVTADAEFPLSVNILDSAGAVKATIVASDRSALVMNVPTGTYYVSVAAGAADTGAYHLSVVNLATPTVPDHGHGHGDPGHAGESAAEAIFARFDTNGDDAVSLIEFEANSPGGKTVIADQVFTRLDANADGSLSMDEVVEGLAKLHMPHARGRAGGLVAPIVTTH